MNYIKLPLNFASLLKGESKRNCSIEESIAQYILMLVTTRYGEVAGRSDYGSAIWELEFNQLVKVHEWEETVRKSIYDSVIKYEKRLNNIIVKVDLSEIDIDTNISHVRRKAVIYVYGNMVNSNIPFSFNTTVFVSPLSQ